VPVAVALVLVLGLPAVPVLLALALVAPLPPLAAELPAPPTPPDDIDAGLVAPMPALIVLPVVLPAAGPPESLPQPTNDAASAQVVINGTWKRTCRHEVFIIGSCDC
jgi:hypothetical protein